MTKKRTVSSQNWLKRWHQDPYVKKAKQEGFRARSAYKIIEINEKYNIFKPKGSILEIGAAPGGWTEAIIQVAPESCIVALDRLEMAPIQGVTILQGDIETLECFELIQKTVGSEKVDAVVSDAAPNTIGHPSTDHLRLMAIVESVWGCAQSLLKQGGNFVCKGWQGNDWGLFVAELRKCFNKVHHIKPPSSQKGSREVFVVALGYKGDPDLAE